MKKRYFSIAVLSLALAFVSCKKDDKSGTAGDMMRFTATIDNGGVKTVIDGVNVKWVNGDQININGKTFTAEVEGTGETAVFTSEPGETVEGTPYKALYPESLYKDVDSYELPNEQTYNSANNLSGINPMYAESSTTELQFHHLCGLLKLDVKGEGKVKKIEVSKDGEALCGPFTITGNRAVVTSETAGSTVTLNCGDGVEINNTTAKTFYIALPEGNYKDLNVKLINGSVSKDTTLSAAIHAGQIRTKELTGVSISTPTPPAPSYLPGEFSINAGGTKVKFSRGNLYYDVVAGEWAFYENQTDHATVYDDKLISLFTWGYGTWSTTPSTETYETGTFTDWGSTMGSGWRTLSQDEWNYLLRTRTVKGGTGYGNTCVWATVNSVDGLIIFHDDYTDATTGLTSIPEGAVFLPAAGRRDGTSVTYVGSGGFYWSSSPSELDSAYHLGFESGYVYPANSKDRNGGFSVRLVQDVE